MHSTAKSPDLPSTDVVGPSDRAARALETVLEIHQAQSAPQVLDILIRATSAIGASASIYTAAIPECGNEPSSFSLFACHPAFAHKQFSCGNALDHPWFRFARTHSSSGTDQLIDLPQANDREALNFARQHGFASCLVVPIHQAANLERVEMLCLGNSDPGAFERDDARIVRSLGRALAEELHDWVSQHLRESLRSHARLQDSDLELLNMEWRGLSTKEISVRTGLTAATVDSRFQRLNVRMECANRKASARRAAEYGLFDFGHRAPAIRDSHG